MHGSAAFDNSTWGRKAGSNIINAASHKTTTDFERLWRDFAWKDFYPFFGQSALFKLNAIIQVEISLLTKRLATLVRRHRCVVPLDGPVSQTISAW
jgi:hypothetical protein